MVEYQSLPAQAPAKEYQVKAAFLFNFTQFIDWPSSSFEGAGAPFVIGILGDNPFGNYLDEVVANEKVGAHSLVVRRYHDTKEAANCHLLFINSNETETRNALSTLSGHSILTVSDAYNFTELGGMIRFLIRDGKVRFQINQRAAKRAQLAISSKLLRVADTTN